MKTFAIGDVHGQFIALKKLLDSLPINWQEDELVFLGDLVDRGPQSREVIDFVIKLYEENSNKVRVLKGNHEEMLLDSYNNKEDFSHWLSNGGDATFASYCKNKTTKWEIFNKEFPLKAYEYLKNRPISYENEHAIFVHAGFKQDSFGQWRADSPLIALWHRSKDFFRRYQGKTVVVGHTPTNKIRLMFGEALMPIEEMTAWSRNNIIAIDCGAGHEGRLCAVELPGGNLFYQSIIDSRTQHQLLS
ncbi:MAG: serine/threonine protein phosphatase [Acidobacteria bacterium]|nr:serine/threonine protein phosphatase [Acidobacteriota bacterium]